MKEGYEVGIDLANGKDWAGIPEHSNSTSKSEM